MNQRAFIIAIEDYPLSSVLARQLPGTNEGAEAFRNWLIKKKKAPAENILACAGHSCKWRTTGTTHDEIVAELQKLAQLCRDENNDELYFYFSGHGFSYDADNARIQIDVLVASDFVDTDNSGDACLQFQEIQKKLWNSLGPGNHYYFIDACRNPISINDIEIPVMGRRFPMSTRGRSKFYVLYSTALGQVAKVKSGFTELLLRGLNGDGTAKKWEAGRMYVTFERLRDYLKTKLKGQEIEASSGADSDGFILELKPVPVYDCDVIVDNAAPGDTFTLKVSNELIQTNSLRFKGRSYTLPLKPFDYYLEVTHRSAQVIQIDPPAPGPLSVYDPVVVHFQKETPPRISGGSRPAVSPPARLSRSGRLVASPPSAAHMNAVRVTFEAAPNTEIHLVNEESGKKFSGTHSLTARLPLGRYIAEVMERGILIQKRSVTITPGKYKTVDLLERPKSEVRERILNSFSHAKTTRYAEFSETLGSMANWDLSLWLSVFGASHIACDAKLFRMLKDLPIDKFTDVRKGDSPVYILAGFEKSEGRFDVALSDTDKVKWKPLDKVKTLVGIYEKRIKARPGSHLLSLRMEKHPPITMAVYCLSNRATFVTFAEDPEGRLTIHQYLLPIYRLSKYLDRNVLRYLELNPLSVVRTMALSQSRFANNHQVTPKKGTNEKRDWDALMFGKWLDPIMSLIACYEIIRCGQVQSYTDNLRIVIKNLRTYFPGIPDTEVIAHLIGMKTNEKANKIKSPPLINDGVLAYEDMEKNLPLPASKLDYTTSWTAWRGAVNEAALAEKRGNRKSTPSKPIMRKKSKFG